MPTLQLYGTDWCGQTKTLAAHLRFLKVPFTFRNVEQDPDADWEVRAMNDGKLKFPMVTLDDTHLKNPDVLTLEKALEYAGLIDPFM